jgi:hypothetical protein
VLRKIDWEENLLEREHGSLPAMTAGRLRQFAFSSRLICVLSRSSS